MWGADENYADIELNGVRYPVRENLWSFLHQKRQECQYGPYWIDAISINQARVRELNHQVRMMRVIYSSAHLVVVWLGKADDGSDNAMHKMKNWKPFGIGKSDFNKIWKPKEARNIQALCERKYWQRMWIIQEVTLAREAAVHCGSYTLSWQKLVQMCKDLQTIADHGRERHTTCAHAILTSPAMVIVRTKAELGEAPRPLRLLLQTYGDHESTNIRDKVYALVGIAEEASDIVVDYNKSAKDVFLDVMYLEQGRLGDSMQAKDEINRFGKELKKILKVSLSQIEMNSIIRHALSASHRSGNMIIYECHFKFLNCSFLSLDRSEWKKYCISHFENVEPPRSIRCLSCDDLPQQRFSDGWTAWSHKIEHTTQHVELLQEGVSRLCAGPPDFHMFEHLWQTRLIDDLDLEELTVGNHRLAMRPFSRTQGQYEYITEWQSPIERCEICCVELRRPMLSTLDGFRVESHDEIENNYISTPPNAQTAVFKFLRLHKEKSEKIFRDWKLSHQHQDVSLDGGLSHLTHLQEGFNRFRGEPSIEERIITLAESLSLALRETQLAEQDTEPLVDYDSYDITPYVIPLPDNHLTPAVRRENTAYYEDMYTETYVFCC
jgi:hypothetical protein